MCTLRSPERASRQAASGQHFQLCPTRAHRSTADDGNTPLHLATSRAFSNNTSDRLCQVVRVLLTRGADVLAKNNGTWHEHALLPHLTSLGCTAAGLSTALHFAKSACVCGLLCEGGADPNAKNVNRLTYFLLHTSIHFNPIRRVSPHSTTIIVLYM